MYQSTILRHVARPLAPPNAVPFHYAAGDELERARLDLLARAATPMITDTPALVAHSSAWRITSTLPMHSKL